MRLPVSDADHPGFISLVTIIELYWVLTAWYDLTGTQVKEALEALLRAKQIVVDQADQVLRALLVFDASKADFADCLNRAHCLGRWVLRDHDF